jgi:C1A family cysteine protease
VTESIIDLRGEMPSVRDQGQRDTCVSFALTCAHEHSRNAGASLSEQFLHWNARQIEAFPSGGTTIANAAKAISTSGQPPTDTWPYDPSTEQGDPPAACFIERFFADLTPLADGAVAAVRLELATGRPVVVGIPVWSALRKFELNSAGVVPLPATALPRASHAVAIVGHDDQRSALLVRNSWGTSWGQNGYAWLDDTILNHIKSFWTLRPLTT